MLIHFILGFLKNRPYVHSSNGVGWLGIGTLKVWQIRSVLDATSSSYAPHRPLRKPLRINGYLIIVKMACTISIIAHPSSTNRRQPTPTPKHWNDYNSVLSSSTSSYAHSVASSGFTLSSGTTDNSRESSVLFYRKPSEEPGNNTFTVQLKKIYRGISALERKILNEDINKGGRDQGRITLKG